VSKPAHDGRNKNIGRSVLRCCYGVDVPLSGLRIARIRKVVAAFHSLFLRLVTRSLHNVPALCRCAHIDSSSNACAETSIFVTLVLVISAFGLPIVLAHTEAIKWGACALVITGNLVMFTTIGAAFFLFTRDDFDYSSW